MNANEIAVLVKSTLDGSIPFPEIVGKLIANGVEYYHVDYATGSFTFYSASGAAVVAPIAFERLPLISEDFDVGALKAALLSTVNSTGKSFGLFANSEKGTGYFVSVGRRRTMDSSFRLTVGCP